MWPMIDDSSGCPVGKISPRTEANLEKSGKEVVFVGLTISELPPLNIENTPVESGDEGTPGIE